MTKIRTVLAGVAASVAALSIAGMANAGTTDLTSIESFGTSVPGSYVYTGAYGETFTYTVPKYDKVVFTATSGAFSFPYSDTGPTTASHTITSTSAGTLDYTVFLTSAPEPATWALMLVGVGGVGFAMRRRAKAAKSSVAAA